jgi:hypothetical protein
VICAIRVLVLTVVALGVQVVGLSEAIACGSGANWSNAHSGCVDTGTGNAAGSYWRQTEDNCVRPNGKPGVWYILVTNGVEGERRCRVAHSDFTEGGVSPAQVLRAMQRLTWPGSDLVIQPPEGRTLVNFATNFLTENTEPTTQRVTLLGQRIVIEATPSSYHWDFGDGTETTTSTPGARYPDLEVTHEYAKKGRYAPSVGTTYTGRYRVNGGPWLEIPGTHTVAGEPVELEVIGAKPTLVGAGE